MNLQRNNRHNIKIIKPKLMIIKNMDNKYTTKMNIKNNIIINIIINKIIILMILINMIININNMIKMIRINIKNMINKIIIIIITQLNKILFNNKINQIHGQNKITTHK